MTVLLPTPRTIAFRAARLAVDQVRDRLVAWLTRTPPGPRHRLRTPGEIRWQHWKSVLAGYLATGLRTGPAPHPDGAARPRGRGLPTPTWTVLHPPPRTAQPGGGIDDRVADPAPAWDALPPVRPEITPEVSSEITLEITPAVCSEVWPDEADTRFAEYLAELATVEPAVAGHGVAGHGVAEHPVTRHVVAEHTVPRHALAEPAITEPITGLPVAEPEVWEFTPGDLTRWWDEAAARLDAAARDEPTERLW